MKEYVVDANSIASFDDFVSVFNKDFCSRVGGKWKGSPDALIDYLSWPCRIPGLDTYRLRIVGADKCREVLDENVLQELGWAANSADTLFDAIVEIIRDNDSVRLSLE